jgi:uncharacterized protein (DUF2062 family)
MVLRRQLVKHQSTKSPRTRLKTASNFSAVTLKLERHPDSLAATVAALLFMSLIPFAPLKLARCPRALAATVTALPSMSLIPFAPLPLSEE